MQDVPKMRLSDNLATNLAPYVATFMHRLLDTHCHPQPQLCTKRHIYCGIYRMSQKSEFQTILPQILPQMLPHSCTGCWIHIAIPSLNYAPKGIYTAEYIGCPKKVNFRQSCHKYCPKCCHIHAQVAGYTLLY